MSQPHRRTNGGGGGGRGGGGKSAVGPGHPRHQALSLGNSNAAAVTSTVVSKAPTTTKQATAGGDSAAVSFSLPPVPNSAAAQLHHAAGHVGSSLHHAAATTDTHATRGRGGADGVGLEPSGQTLRMGRAAGSMTTIYRSVPPRPLSYTFSDVLKTSLAEPRIPGRAKRCRSKTAPVSTNAPEEYAERFKARPTTRPAVIDFNGASVKMYAARGGCRQLNSLGFPAVKSRTVAPVAPKPKTPTPVAPQQPQTERGTTATSSLHLAPLSGKGVAAEPDASLSLQARSYRPPPLPLHSAAPKTPDLTRFHGALRSAASSVKSRGKSSGSSQRRRGRVNERPQGGKSAASSLHRLTTTGGSSDGQWQELSSSKLATLDALTFSISPRGGATGDPLGFPEALAHSDDYDDLSELPRPKRILPRRDLPWVFRFKVKKEMNALSKIMASKPTSAANSMTATAGPIA